MSKKNGKSKRQVLREKRQRQKQIQRIGMIAIVTVGVLLVAFAFIYPQLKPVGEVIAITPQQYALTDGVAIGDPNAPVRIDVFEDFQCPACVQYTTDTEPLVIRTFVETGQAYYVFHNFPFIDDYSAGSESDQAASASMCANEQGQFWPYHELVYANWNGENIGTYSDQFLVALAESLNLEMVTFNACFESGRYMAEIDADYQLGTQMGVQGTPSVFVNGELLTPGYIPSVEVIQQAVEAALANP